MAASPPRPTPSQRLDWAAEGRGVTADRQAGRALGGAGQLRRAPARPPCKPPCGQSWLGGRQRRGRRDGLARRRGSDASQRFGAAAEGLAGRPLPRREPRGTFAARPTDGAGDAALPGSSGMTGRARRGRSPPSISKISLSFKQPHLGTDHFFYLKPVGKKELEFQDLTAVLNCIHSFIAAKVASLDPLFIDSQSIARKYTYSN
uniref:Uncharacterized protein n=1 Tax=Sphaerodactylus townsendi TaxID=933632 RepID=A0ACB8GDK7_9SAUR